MAALLAVAGCRTAPPEAAVNYRFGVVRAETPAAAEEMGELAEELLPRVRGLLPDTRERQVEVWLQPDIELIRGAPYPEHIAGMADFEQARIHLRQRDERLRLHLSHEMVHLLLGDSWSPLPGVIEEGMCDIVAVLLAPAEGQEHHVKRLIEASGFFGGFEAMLEVASTPVRRPPQLRETHHLRLTFADQPRLSIREALELDDRQVFELATAEDGVGLYGLGYLVTLAVVQRVGFEGLHDLCDLAIQRQLERVPIDWLLREGGLMAGGSGLRRALARFVGPAELEQMAGLLAVTLAEAVAEIAADGPQTSLDAFLRQGRPVLRIPQVAQAVPLERIAPFMAALRERWPFTSIHDV